MIAPQVHHVQGSVDARNQELAQELQRIEKRDWWIWIYTVFVILLLTFAVIALTLPALHEGAETIFKIKLSQVVFGLIALVFLFNFYTIYQQILIKRLRRQLAEKQGHSDRLNKVIRGADLAVRFGGDEFLVLLPECTTQQLQLVLGRLGSLEVDWRGQKIPVTFSAGWKQYEMGERPEEMLGRADELLYARKRASKNTQTLRDEPQEASGQGPQRKTGPAPLNVLVDLTCPHCNRNNSVAVDAHSGASNAGPREVQCAHCKQVWAPVLSGPVLAGPFPK